MFPTSSERLIGISHAFSAFIRHLAHVLAVPPTKARLLCATPAGLDLYYIYTGHACRHLPSAVHWISEDRLLEEGAGKRCSECEALPDLVTPLKGHAVFISAQLSTDAVSALRKVLLLI